jgi:VCBS repeat-containing protein
VYTPRPDSHGIDTFSYQVCDQGTPIGCDTATVTVTVTAVPDAPVVATVPPLSTPTGTALSGSVAGTASDPDGEVVSYQAATPGAAHGTLVVQPEGSFTYTPEPDFSGTDTLAIDACDTTDRCSPVVVTVNVTDATPVRVTISGRVFIDLDTDGLDDGEPGVEGVTVSLLPVNAALRSNQAALADMGSVVTGADGSFVLTATPGQYRIHLVLPRGYLIAANSTIDPTTGLSGVLDLDSTIALQLRLGVSTAPTSLPDTGASALAALVLIAFVFLAAGLIALGAAHQTTR